MKEYTIRQIILALLWGGGVPAGGGAHGRTSPPGRLQIAELPARGPRTQRSSSRAAGPRADC